MIFDPKHLHALHVIQVHGGLTAAARALGTSQPALSRLVSDMEIRLDAPLFDRSKRPWSMTNLGESLATQGAAIRLAQERAEDAIDLFRSGIGGEINFGATPFFNDGVLISMISEFQSSHPAVRVNQHYGYTENLFDRLKHRQLDLAVCPLEPTGPDQEITVHSTIEVKNIIACRRDHPLNRLSSARPLALLDYDWIAPPPGSPLNRDMRDVLSTLEVKDITVGFSGGSLAAIASYLEHSNALTVLPELVVKSLSTKFDISVLPISFATPNRQLAIATNRDDIRSNTLNHIIEHLDENLREVAGRQ
ncbi:MAG: LysR family transcriptional regulator [Pseudomonadota bacterium]